MSNVFASPHPLVAHKLSRLRDKNTEPKKFRELVREIAALLAYEATADLLTTPRELETPLEKMTGAELKEKIGLVPILRAGLGMAEGIWGLMPSAEVWHIGLYRDEHTLRPVEYYNKLPIDPRVSVCLILDPMLATGGSATATADILKRWGVKKIKFVGLIAAPEGIKAMQTAHPDIDIFIAAIDDHLNERAYIVPGLGDAGDRQLGRDKMTDTLQIDDQRIAYTEAGSDSNPPVLLLHGIMSHRGVWSRTFDTLKRNFHCIAIDHLGFGNSDKPSDADYSISKQAERALKVADHFGFDHFSVIGHSMGGQVATYLAASLAPQRVQKLISVDGVVTGQLSKWVQNFTRVTVSMGDKTPELYSTSLAITKTWKAYACFVFRPWFYDICGLSYESWALYRQMAFNEEIAHSTPKAWDSLNATDLTHSIKNIAAPTLVIFGKQDGTVPVSQAYLFKKQLPAARLVLIDECGHFPMYEKFDEYIKPLQEFLE